MDWLTFLQVVTESAAPEMAHEAYVEVEVEGARLILEHVEEARQAQATYVLGPLPLADASRPGLMQHLLKQNMQLQAAAMGAVACDASEAEIVWRHVVSLDHATPDDVIEMMREVVALRSSLVADGWLREAASSAAEGSLLEDLLEEHEAALLQSR